MWDKEEIIADQWKLCTHTYTHTNTSIFKRNRYLLYVCTMGPGVCVCNVIELLNISPSILVSVAWYGVLFPSSLTVKK